MPAHTRAGFFNKLDLHVPAYVRTYVRNRVLAYVLGNVSAAVRLFIRPWLAYECKHARSHGHAHARADARLPACLYARTHDCRYYKAPLYAVIVRGDASVDLVGGLFGNVGTVLNLHLRLYVISRPLLIFRALVWLVGFLKVVHARWWTNVFFSLTSWMNE